MSENTNRSEDNKIIRNCCLRNFLNDHAIVVPKIQRDYAMGRVTETEKVKRREFLTSIKNALEEQSSLTEEQSSLTLDFVYGNTDKDSNFYPLDGQQRLTTLWLVHWYLLSQLGEIKNGKNEWIKKFKYETRRSSTSFCEQLCKIDLKELKENNSLGKQSIAEYIKSQTWFYSEWIQDSTINSMLRTISGDSTLGLDCIEGIFNIDKVDGDKLKTYLDKLNSVTFHVLVISAKKIPNTDDLYVKMNARGKKLTDFENFKSDLLASLSEDDSIKWATEIDNKWTDVFWKKNNAENKQIDDIFFLFINRFVLNKFISSSKFPSKDVIRKYCITIDENNDASIEEIDDASKPDTNKNILIQDFFGFLYDKDKKTKNNIIPYLGFSYYKLYLDVSAIEELDNVFSFLSDDKIKVEPINSVIEASDDDETDDNVQFDSDDLQKNTIDLIPQYSNGYLVTSQKTLVHFFALTSFVRAISKSNITSEEKNTLYQHWSRIIGNLIENAQISSIDAMISSMKVISTLSTELEKTDDKDIYGILARYVNDRSEVDVSGIDNSDNAMHRQLEEEVWKAYLIRICGWNETEICNAEHFSFFNGAIRFLLRDAYGNYIDNKVEFDKKLKTANAFFSNGNVINNQDALDRYRNLFTSFDEPTSMGINIFSTTGYKTRGLCWKSFLCDKRNAEKVHMFLDDTSTLPSQEQKYKDFWNNNKDLVKRYEEKDRKIRKKNCYQFQQFNGVWTIHFGGSHSDYLYLYNGRKELCEKIHDLNVNGKIELVGNPEPEYIYGYYVGKDIKFKFPGDRQIYLWGIKQAARNQDAKNQLYKLESDENGNDKTTEINDLNELSIIKDKLKAIDLYDLYEKTIAIEKG